MLTELSPQVSAGEFSAAGKPAEQLQAALDTFDREFWPHRGEMAERCFFVEDATGRVVGTTTAWYGEMMGRTEGRIHWVAVAATHMGCGLSKVLLAAAMQYMHAR